MDYTFVCTSCGADAHTSRAADLRNRYGRRCQACKNNLERPEQMPPQLVAWVQSAIGKSKMTEVSEGG